MLAIAYLAGLMLAVLAVFMLFPIFVAFAYGEWDCVLIFLVSMGLTTFVAGTLVAVAGGKEPPHRRRDLFLLPLVMWVMVPLFAGLPFYASGIFESPFQVYFEFLSAFTTTGASLLTQEHLHSMHQSFLFWRVLVDWIGGFATLGCVLLIFSPIELGGLPSWVSKVGNSAHQHLLSQAMALGWLPSFYLLITFACVFSLLFWGVPLFDALSLSFSVLSTSGFDPTGGKIPFYGFAVQTTLAIFLLLGSTNILWMYAILTKRWSQLRKQESYYETIWFFFMAVCCSLIFGFLFYIGREEDLLLSFFQGALTAISLVSTSGLQLTLEGYSLVPIPFLFLLIVGGASFSTAGGIKVFRFGSMLLQTRWEIRRLLYPHGMRNMQIGDWFYNLQTLKAIWLVFLSFLMAWVLGWMGLAFTGMDFSGSAMASLANLSNSGNVYATMAVDFPSWGFYSDMPPERLSVLMFLMILGRFEVLGFLVLCSFFSKPS